MSRYMRECVRRLAPTQALGAPMGAVLPITTTNPQNACSANQTKGKA